MPALPLSRVFYKFLNLLSLSFQHCTMRIMIIFNLVVLRIKRNYTLKIPGLAEAWEMNVIPCYVAIPGVGATPCVMSPTK